MTIAERVRAYRKQPPYPSLRTMAADLGITAAYLSEIERGLRIPKGALLERLARLLGTTAERIHEEKGDVRIVQISATAVEGQVVVACLLSDGTIRIAYPELAAEVASV